MGPVVANRRLAIMILPVLLIGGCASTTSTVPPAQGSYAPSEAAVTAAPTPSPTPQPTATLTAAATPTPLVTPRPVGAAWTEVPAQSSVRAVQMLDVAWTGKRFVAVGGGAFLDSTDGVIWHRHKADIGVGFTRLASGPAGVVAVDGLSSWTSSDGLAWAEHSKVFRIPDVGSDSVTVTDVVATSGGWLAVGRQDPECQTNCGSEPTKAWVWTSDDGVSWTRVADQEAFKGGGMVSVARGSSGFVAVGAAAGHAAIWTSPDGLTWSRVPDDPMFHGPSSLGGLPVAVTGVAIRDGVTVVVGVATAQDTCPSGDAATSCPGVRAWWTADGHIWSKASVEKAKDGQVFGVATTIDGFLATGPSGGTSCLGGIWRSADGRAWRCDASAAAFQGFGPYAAAASDTVEVTVGLTHAGWDENSGAGMPGAVWYRTWS